MALQGKRVSVDQLNDKDRATLYHLMDAFYDHVTPEAFHQDLAEKDHCILLTDDSGTIQGFSTQKTIQVEVAGQHVSGVFSGDTIIHSNHRGSLELFKVFARHYIAGQKESDPFYWFLITKGYKTYKMLPLFFNSFYPDYRKHTPSFEQAVIHAFGQSRYAGAYDLSDGVIHYQGVKDRLKPGVADVMERQRRDPHTAFFLKANPGYIQGNDLVCLARLSADNLNRTAHRLLLGKGKDQNDE